MGCIFPKTRRRKAKSAKRLIPFLDVEVHVTADDKCSFSGITCVKGGKIVVADYLSQNVKYYDWKMLKLINHVELTSPPYEVCLSAVEESEIFVTVPFDKKIMHFKLGETQMELIEEIKTEGRCYGISSFKDGLAVSLRIDKHNWQIEILDYTGSIKKVFKDDENGRELFGFADYVTTDQDGSRLYIADGHHNAVCCFDLKNSTDSCIKEIYRYSDTRLKIPKGVVLDGSDNLFVVGCESCNVHKVSSYGEKLEIVLTHKNLLENPMGVEFDHVEKKLFVTEGSRKVMIFKHI